MAMPEPPGTPGEAVRRYFSASAQKGATVIEYALIAALISVIAIIALQQIGTKVLNQYDTVENQVASI